MNMKRSELEQHIGKRVQIKLLDDEVMEGVLFKTGTEIFKDNPNLYIPQNYYVLAEKIYGEMKSVSCIFRCSHVRKLKEV